jgi:hypothetical protein
MKEFSNKERRGRGRREDRAGDVFPSLSKLLLHGSRPQRGKTQCSGFTPKEFYC